MALANVILGSINWCLNFIAMMIFVAIIFVMMKNRREFRTVALLVTLNTCVGACLTCLAVCFMILSNLTTGFLAVNHPFCIFWGLLYDVFECLIYHSYYLQAFYRLCRVVFYKKKALLSYSLYVILIISQWVFVFILIAIPVFVNWYAKLTTEEYCLVPYTVLVPQLYLIVILYLIPLSLIAIMYLWITNYIRQSSLATTTILGAQQRQRNQRDLTVTRRIIMLLSTLVILRFPTIIFMIDALITGVLFHWTFAIVGLITSLCLIFIGLITIHITPELRKYLAGRLTNRVEGQQTEENQQKTGTVRAIRAGTTQPINTTNT